MSDGTRCWFGAVTGHTVPMARMAIAGMRATRLSDEDIGAEYFLDRHAEPDPRPGRRRLQGHGSSVEKPLEKNTAIPFRSYRKPYGSKRWDTTTGPTATTASSP